MAASYSGVTVFGTKVFFNYLSKGKKTQNEKTCIIIKKYMSVLSQNLQLSARRLKMEMDINTAKKGFSRK